MEANFEPSSDKSGFFTGAELPWGWRERAFVIQHDPRPHKLDLSAGMVRGDDGRLLEYAPVLKARSLIPKAEHAYLPAGGLPEFCAAIRGFILGEDPIRSFRPAFAIQTIGAANALRLGADCLVRLGLASEIFVSAESWADHRRIFERAGMRVTAFPYLNKEGTGIDAERLLGALEAAPERSVVLLQTSCHNPTGYDPPPELWERIFDIIESRRLLPFFDAAYPGFAKSIEEDLSPIRRCMARGVEFLAAASCCKLFSLYDARVGALIGVLNGQDRALRLESQIKVDIQASYSSPPRDGAATIAAVLADPKLRDELVHCVASARRLLLERREFLCRELSAADAPESLLAIRRQSGIFAWTGISPDASKGLAAEHGIYIPSNGRACIGTLPYGRIPDFAQALVRAVKGS